MALFNRYLIVDWSAASTPGRGANSLWACLAEGDDRGVKMLWLENFPTRAEFMQCLSTVVEETLASGLRLLAGFDFAFGYPAGTAKQVTGSADWRALWRKIAADIEDAADNRNNRFELASRWNASYFSGEPRFWGRPHQHRYAHLSDTKPPAPASPPFVFRRSEHFAKGAKSVWQMSYNGSVGGQTLLGIARLSRFLDESGQGEQIAVWPFETGFVECFDKPVVFAEIYPSLFTLPDSSSVKDAVQVATAADAFARYDQDGRLAQLLGPPPMLNEEELALSIAEEGWVLGIGHENLGLVA
ncbi:hypothetical protein [Rhizobium paknamense]|uniref:Precorrin-8X/cobalt-precorrin-8 methylmutase n=1 Tax=Rhizobium paknamense TaxID=1206817 RepID=A0ABU0ICC9_9HYPH|nr:hypothetical protein [Rhizobium paknamense]MDQ0455898.1 precorrin-8X/cobalt-precorrin-8 methylmutase [Rhizobium paknamense]